MAAGLVFGNLTDVGRTRARNEDSAGAFGPDAGRPERGRLFVVADGMGGMANGDVASRLAVDTFRDTFYSPDAPDEAEAALRVAVRAANRSVHREGERDGDRSRMGTTLTALLVRGTDAYLAHVGDSRAYVVRRGAIRQITEDHSRVAELVRKGVIGEADAEHHPESHVILRALGIEPHVEVDVIGPMPLAGGEVFVLCTDGLTRTVRPDEIRRLSRGQPQEACRRLVALANERGGPDNVTVQVIRVGPARRLTWRTIGIALAVIVAVGAGTVTWVRIPPRAPAASSPPTPTPASAIRAAIAPGRPTRQVLPLSTVRDVRSLTVSGAADVAGLDGDAAFVVRTDGSGADRAPTVLALPQTGEGATAHLKQVTFAADGSLYGVAQRDAGAREIEVLRLHPPSPTGARGVLRIVGEDARPQSWISRIFRRPSPEPMPVARVERPTDAVVAIGDHAVTYLLLPDRLLRAGEREIATLTDKGFQPKGEPGTSPLPVASIAVGAGDVIVARVQGPDVVVERVGADRLDRVMTVAVGGERPRGVAVLAEDRVALLMPDHVRVAERSGARIADVSPRTRTDAGTEGRAVEIVAVLSSAGGGTEEWVIQPGDRWTLGPRAGAPGERTATRVVQSALSADGQWLVFVVQHHLYRVHLAGLVGAIASGWTSPNDKTHPRRSK